MGRLRRNARLALAAAAIAGLGVKAQAQATQPTTEQLMQKIDLLQQKVDQLEAKQTDTVSAKEVDATVERVITDAEQRSQLLQMEGFTAGYTNKRFVLQSADGNYVFRPWLHLQFRYSTALRQDEKASGANDTQSGFEVRRARFGFDGNLVSPDIQYMFNWATYRGSGTSTVTDSSGNTVGTTSNGQGGLPVLEEAWMKYQFHDTPYAIRAGQMHDPLDHENIVGSKYRAPEASLQGDIFGNTDTFTQAVTFIYDPKAAWRFEGGVTDGIRAANTNFEDWPNNGIKYNWGVAGRAEYKFMGDWKDYNQLTALGNTKDLLVAGLGLDYSEGGDTNSLSHTLDVQYGGTSGLFLYGSYFGRYTKNNTGIPLGAPVSTNFGKPGTSGDDTYEWSVLAQGAYLFPNNFEPYIRYEYLYLAGTPAGSVNGVDEISLGVNYYLSGHNVKFTGEVMYLCNGIPISDDSHDVLVSNGKGETVIILQMQLLI